MDWVDQWRVLLQGKKTKQKKKTKMHAQQILQLQSACSPSCPTHLSRSWGGLFSIPPCPVQLLPSCLHPVSSPLLLLHSTSSLPVLWKFTASYKRHSHQTHTHTHTHTHTLKESSLRFPLVFIQIKTSPWVHSVSSKPMGQFYRYNT